MEHVCDFLSEAVVSSIKVGSYSIHRFYPQTLELCLALNWHSWLTFIHLNWNGCKLNYPEVRSWHIIMTMHGAQFLILFLVSMLDLFCSLNAEAPRGSFLTAFSFTSCISLCHSSSLLCHLYAEIDPWTQRSFIHNTARRATTARALLHSRWHLLLLHLAGISTIHLLPKPSTQGSTCPLTVHPILGVSVLPSESSQIHALTFPRLPDKPWIVPHGSQNKAWLL